MDFPRWWFWTRHVCVWRHNVVTLAHARWDHQRLQSAGKVRRRLNGVSPIYTELLVETPQRLYEAEDCCGYCLLGFLCELSCLFWLNLKLGLFTLLLLLLLPTRLLCFADGTLSIHIALVPHSGISLWEIHIWYFLLKGDWRCLYPYTIRAHTQTLSKGNLSVYPIYLCDFSLFNNFPLLPC